MRFVLRHVVAFWLYFTPVIYPLSMLPPDYRWLAYLNPLTAPVELFKWALLPGAAHSWAWVGYSATVTVVAFSFGSWYFARQEHATMDKL
jgi:lipopolysaccharide transport system permease protein